MKFTMKATCRRFKIKWKTWWIFVNMMSHIMCGYPLICKYLLVSGTKCSIVEVVFHLLLQEEMICLRDQYVFNIYLNLHISVFIVCIVKWKPIQVVVAVFLRWTMLFRGRVQVSQAGRLGLVPSCVLPKSLKNEKNLKSFSTLCRLINRSKGNNHWQCCQWLATVATFTTKVLTFCCNNRDECHLWISFITPVCAYCRSSLLKLIAFSLLPNCLHNIIV